MLLESHNSVLLPNLIPADKRYPKHMKAGYLAAQWSESPA